MENKREQIRSNPTPVQERYRAEEEASLLEVLMVKSARNRTSAKQVIASGRVSVDDRWTTRATETVSAGTVITVHKGVPPAPFTHPKLEIVWENNDYVVAHKKNGLPTVNTSHNKRQDTALFLLSRHYKKGDEEAKIFMVNRLDRNTAGFVVFAKNINAKELLVKEWSRRVKRQTFVACIEGELEGKETVLSATSDDTKGNSPKLISARVKVDKSGANDGMHIVQAEVGGVRIFSLRKLFGDNGLSIMGDVRSKSQFKTDNSIALEQIALEITFPGEQGTKHFERPYPTHYFSWLRYDKKEI
ncbi:MAG: pseudouridine synthase [Porphyromonas sp.]|nr:pseudouridine synthase [Porphyromonas sp.]